MNYAVPFSLCSCKVVVWKAVLERPFFFQPSIFVNNQLIDLTFSELLAPKCWRAMNERNKQQTNILESEFNKARDVHAGRDFTFQGEREAGRKQCCSPPMCHTPQYRITPRFVIAWLWIRFFFFFHFRRKNYLFFLPLLLEEGLNAAWKEHSLPKQQINSKKKPKTTKSLPLCLWCIQHQDVEEHGSAPALSESLIAFHLYLFVRQMLFRPVS